jgi:hypothetical protein
MATIYKKKILKEIETIPEKHLKSIYNIIHLFNNELNMATKKNVHAETLAGIWKGKQITDDLIKEAKKSVFPYEVNKGRNM